MNILHVLNHLSPEDGYAIRSINIIKNQNKYHDIHVLTSSSNEESKKDKIVTLDNVLYHSFQSNKCMDFRYVGSMYKSYVFRKNIKEIVINDEIDVIHTHSPAYYPKQSYKASHAKNIPIIYEVRGVWEDTEVALGSFSENSWKYKHRKNAETKIMKKVDCIITISEGLRNDIINRGIEENKVYTIPNGVDSDIFVPIKKNHELAQKHILTESAVIAYIGSIRKLEGIEYLIKAMPYVVHHNKNVKLLLIGGMDEIEYIEELKNLAKDLGVAKSILFIGRVPHNEILNYYSLVDIIVIPRIRAKVTELVTPLKPLEAMAMEKLVICSDVGGLRELIQDNKTGILFEAENAFALSEKINYFVENEGERNKIGKAARKYVVAERNWKNITKNYDEIYTHII